MTKMKLYYGGCLLRRDNDNGSVDVMDTYHITWCRSFEEAEIDARTVASEKNPTYRVIGVSMKQVTIPLAPPSSLRAWVLTASQTIAAKIRALKESYP